MRKLRLRPVWLSLSLLLFINISFVGGAAQTGARSARSRQGRDTVLFESVGYGDKQIIVPIVLIRGGRYVAPPPFNMAAARRQFANSYYRQGQQYRLLHKRGQVGTVTVKDTETCDAIAASVEVQTAAELDGRALATNSDSLGTKPVEAHWPSDPEEMAIMKLVKTVYRQRKVAPPVFQGDANTAVSTDLDGDGKAEVIGSFVSGAKSEHTLFLIAEPRGNGFTPALLEFHQARDQFGDNQVRYSFLDALDLDGDGKAEVIASVNDYRSPDDWNFVIYKKQGGRWRGVYRGGGFRCPSERGEH